MIDIFISIIVGIFIGIFVGLIPGINTNLIVVVLLSLFYALDFDPLLFSIIIISVGLTNTFVDIIPSIFLGVPESERIFNALPGHKFLLKGKANDAIIISTFGGIFSIITGVLLIPLIITLIEIVYYSLKQLLPYLLLIIILFILTYKKFFKEIIISFFVFITSGILGLIILRSNVEQPLFVLLSGLFGISNLFVSLINKTKLVEQKQSVVFIDIKKTIMTSIKSIMSCVFITLFPGLGPSQGAFISRSIFKQIDVKYYLMLTSGIATFDFFISLITFYTINKTRNGAIVGIKDLINGLNLELFLFFIGVLLFVSGIAAIITLFLSKAFILFINKINYIILNIIIILFITLLSFLISGFYGFFVLIISSFIGLIPILLRSQRSNLMGCLLIPTLVLLFS